MPPRLRIRSSRSVPSPARSLGGDGGGGGDGGECRPTDDGGSRCCETDDESGVEYCIALWCPPDADADDVDPDCDCRVEIGGSVCGSCDVCGAGPGGVRYDCTDAGGRSGGGSACPSRGGGDDGVGVGIGGGKTGTVLNPKGADPSGAGRADPGARSETPGSGLDYTRIIIYACAGVGGLLLLALCLFLIRRYRRRTKGRSAVDSGSSDGDGRGSDPEAAPGASSEAETETATPPVRTWRNPTPMSSEAESADNRWQLSTVGDDGMSTHCATMIPRGAAAASSRAGPLFHADALADPTAYPPPPALADPTSVPTGYRDYRWGMAGAAAAGPPPSRRFSSSDDDDGGGGGAGWMSAAGPPTAAEPTVPGGDWSAHFSGDGLTLADPTDRSVPTPPAAAAAPEEDEGEDRLIDIYAPPGKLGIELGSPDGGPPIVARVYDTCRFADSIRPGDRLMALDDRDVGSMGLDRLSKMIELKGGNPSRKVTVLRSAGAA